MTKEEEKKYFKSFVAQLHGSYKEVSVKFNEKERWPDVVWTIRDDFILKCKWFVSTSTIAQCKHKGKTFKSQVKGGFRGRSPLKPLAAEYVIAVELTELLHGKNSEKQKLRKQEALEEVLCFFLTEELNKRDFPKKFYFSVSLDHRRALKDKKEARHISKYITSFLLKEVRGLEFNGLKKLHFENACLKKHGVSRVQVIFSDNITMINGNISSMGTIVPEVEYDEIASIIAKKDDKISDETVKFNEAWLVIVVTIDAATWRIGLEKLKNMEFESKYDMVFVFCTFPKEELFPLKIKKR